MLAELVDARSAVRSLGGDRVHSKYTPGVSEEMMGSLDLYHAASDQDFADVHALAVEALGPHLASLDEIKRVDGLTGATIWVVRRKDAVSGFLATLPLTGEGVAALIDGKFTADNIRPEWLARMGEPLAGWYCWCYAGRDQVSRGTLVLALRTLIDGHFPDLPFFGKESSEAGARIMRHLGFHSVEGVDHLFWRCANVMGDMPA